MKVITIASQKGGVGKSTLSVNMAVALEVLGFKTALLDMDNGQETATAWSERRKDENLHVEPVNARRLPAMLGAAEANGFEFVVIDTPPAASPEAAEAVERADLVLVPVQPSLPDLDAIKRTARLLTALNRPGFVFINAAPPTATTLIEDAQTLAGQTGLEVCPVVIRQRSAFRSAWPFGQGVVEYEPKGKAAAEVSSLIDFMLAKLQVCKPSNLKKKRA